MLKTAKIIKFPQKKANGIEKDLFEGFSKANAMRKIGMIRLWLSQMDFDAIPILRKALEDEHPKVREEARDALDFLLPDKAQVFSFRDEVEARAN